MVSWGASWKCGQVAGHRCRRLLPIWVPEGPTFLLSCYSTTLSSHSPPHSPGWASGWGSGDPREGKKAPGGGSVCWFNLGEGKTSQEWTNRTPLGLIHTVVVVVVSLLIQLNPRAQNVSRPWRELHRRYKSSLRSTKHESPHRTIETPRTSRSRGGGRTNAAFMSPWTIKILGEGRPRRPRRFHADLHIDTWRGNQSFRITRPDYWRSKTTRHR